jgi:putative FmdB family regulatory protein
MEPENKPILIHEYLCAECKQEFALMLTKKDVSPTCPYCGSQKLFRVATPRERKQFDRL